MKIKDCYIYTYQLPLVQPLQIRNTPVTSRTGAIIQIITDSDLYGFGEAAPLPGLHQENLNDVRRQLKEITPLLIGTHIHNMFKVVDQLQMQNRWLPCVQFAVESALMCIAEESNLPNQKSLLPEPVHDKIYVNALATGNASTILKKVEKSLAGNYRSIKVKVGRNSLEEEIKLVQTIRQKIGDRTTLRLDANRAWDLQDAVTFSCSVKNLSIEYVEEPLKNPGKLPDLFKKTGLPIALDESLIEMSPDSFELQEWINTLILKPAVIGSVRKTLQYIDLAGNLGLKAVISDTFHTGIGLSFLIRLASTITKQTPMGFDTYRWLDDDILIDKLPIKDGCFDLKTVMNLSRKVNFSKLEEVV